METNSCIFCQILAGKQHAIKLYEDELCTAFEDVHPQAPVHLLIIPNKHITSLNSIYQEERELIGHIVERAAYIARMKGLDKNGYRLVTNCGENAGQSVFHLHFHILSGRTFHWPPG